MRGSLGYAWWAAKLEVDLGVGLTEHPLFARIDRSISIRALSAIGTDGTIF